MRRARSSWGAGGTSRGELNLLPPAGGELCSLCRRLAIFGGVVGCRARSREVDENLALARARGAVEGFWKGFLELAQGRALAFAGRPRHRTRNRSSLLGPWWRPIECVFARGVV